MRDPLIDVLRARLYSYAKHADPSTVLDPVALEEADQLLSQATASSGRISYDVMDVVGWLRWCRFLETPGSQVDEDLLVATQMFASLVVAEPSRVPEELHEVLMNDILKSGSPLEWVRQAADVIPRGQEVDPAALDHAITLLHHAVEALPEHPDLGAITGNLGVLLRIRFERAANIDDLHAAVRVLQKAVADSPQHAQRGRMMSDLARALDLRFRTLNDPADLDAAIRSYEDAAAMTTEADRVLYLADLGVLLRRRFGVTESADDLDRAIDISGQAVDATPLGHPNRGAMLTNLCVVRRIRFNSVGRSADLDGAINAARAALATTPAEQATRFPLLSDLGDLLRVRFERVREPADLDAAVEYCREAIDAAPPDAPGLKATLNNLGVALRIRFSYYGRSDDLDEAVAVSERAVARADDADPDQAARLTNLGAVLKTRFEYSTARPDLEEALDATSEAVRLLPSVSPHRAGLLTNLCTLLLERGKQSGLAADFDEAVRAGQDSVAATPPGHPSLGIRLMNLGSAHAERFRKWRRPADARQAIARWREAAALPTAQTDVRVRAAHAWARMALAVDPAPSSAAEGFDAAVRLLPQLAWRGVRRPGQEQLLSEHAGLAGEAASTAITAHRHGAAVELLELGRGVLWSQLLDGQADLTALRNKAPGDADRLDEIRAELDALITSEFVLDPPD
jgi:tetratricopeptide (TPR) repeat protein